MTRKQILADIKEQFGTVPEWLASFPDGELEHDWGLMKWLELGETAIPNKYKELMGLAVSAALRCPYCTYFHTEVARLFGATEEEIREASLYAKMINGFSTYLHGTQYDREKFKREVQDIVAYVRGAMAKKAA